MISKVKNALQESKEKCKRQQAVACKMTDNKKPSDAQNFPYKKQFDKLPDTMVELVDHMNEIQGRMECMHSYNPEVLLFIYVSQVVQRKINPKIMLGRHRIRELMS